MPMSPFHTQPHAGARQRAPMIIGGTRSMDIYYLLFSRQLLDNRLARNY